MSSDLTSKEFQNNFNMRELGGKKVYEFEDFRLDADHLLLFRNGEQLKLTPKVVETLLALVERHGSVLTKQEMMNRLWPDTVVEESNLSQNLYLLRKTLGTSCEGLPFIETMRRRGYRFPRQVTVSRDQQDPVVEPHTIRVEQTENVYSVVDWARDKSERDKTGISPTIVEDPTPERKISYRNRVLAAVIIMFLAVSVTSFVAYRSWTVGVAQGSFAAKTGPRMIAVLPFRIIGTESDSEYLGLGMTESLITQLGKSPQIIVRPAGAVSRYAGSKEDPAEIGRRQGVEAVLDGSIQQIGDRIRVRVQLINTYDNATVWTGQYDEKFNDMFMVQDLISRRVMKELVVELGSYSLTAGTQNAEAYREYMKGRYFWNKRTKEGQDRAIAHFNRAIELDPTYALAYAGLADATVFTYGINLAERNRAISAGRALLYKAIEFDATLAEPHATLGLLAMNVDHDWIEAERLFKRSIELDRSYPTAHQWYGEFLAYMGRFDEGITELELAQELDPLSLIISTDLGQVYYNARQYERSLDQLQKTLEMDPDYVAARQWRGLALSALGRHNEAIAEFEKVPDLRDDQIMLSCAGVVYGEAGRKEKAHWVLERLKALSSETYVWPSSMARAYIGLGDNDGAFKWLEKAFSESDVGVIALKISPVVDSLRDDRRFAGYLRRAGF